MFDPEFFDPLIDLICQKKTVLRKTGLFFVALHTRARVCAYAVHTYMSRSPNIIINKKIEIVIWDNRARDRNGASFAMDVGVTHV